MLATLLMLDANTRENGCLTIVPASHLERYSHFCNGKFVGSIAERHYDDFDRRAVPILGEPGDLCLKHTWAVHGGGPNRSQEPRRLLICDYVAADAFPLTQTAMPARARSPWTSCRI